MFSSGVVGVVPSICFARSKPITTVSKSGVPAKFWLSTIHRANSFAVAIIGSYYAESKTALAAAISGSTSGSGVPPEPVILST